MKKFLLASALTLLLVGAGCEQQAPPPPPAAVHVTESTAEAPRPAPTPAPTPDDSTGDAVDADEGTMGFDPIREPGEAVVMITEGGTFSPAVVTVKAGTKVSWLNTGDRPVWIASDPHPTHDGYPGFDSRAPIGKGEKFSFTFDKAGSWGYHDHFNTMSRGTVVVTQ